MSRLENLADAVFGFALTLLVVSTAVPRDFESLKEVLREPVLDETGDRGPYEYAFELDSADPKRVDQLLQKQLGLRLQRLKRRICVVEISGPAK